MKTVLLPLALLISSADPDPQASFRAGKFAEAESVCVSQLNSYDSILLCGRIALVSNRLRDAESWLSKAHEMRPDAREPESLLAEVYYRSDRLLEAGALRRNVGGDAVARQLESFKGLVPYQIQWPAPVVRVPFIDTDPLPLIAVRVNDSEEVNLLIDTGGAELILDTEYAKRVGAVLFGHEARTFGGGKKAAVEFGRVGSVRLGDQRAALEVKNVPVHVMSTRPFSAAAHGKRMDGVLGTVFLYHFLFTLDYPKGELVLRPRSALSPGAGAIEIPFWMTGIISWSPEAPPTGAPEHCSSWTPERLVPASLGRSRS